MNEYAKVAQRQNHNIIKDSPINSKTDFYAYLIIFGLAIWIIFENTLQAGYGTP